MDVDTRLLRYFVAVAEQLNFTQAARSLFVSQPSLSRQSRQLEERLGTELFVRDVNEVRLTRAGESVIGRDCAPGSTGWSMREAATSLVLVASACAC